VIAWSIGGCSFPKPLEYYRPFFNGRTPTLQEALVYIEGLHPAHDPNADLRKRPLLVQVFPRPPHFQLNIRRRDGQPCKEWRPLPANQE